MKSANKMSAGLLTAHHLVKEGDDEYFAPSFVSYTKGRGWILRKRPVNGYTAERVYARTFAEACEFAEAYRPILEKHVPHAGVFTVKRSGIRRISHSERDRCCFLFNSLFIEYVRGLENRGVIMPKPNYAAYLLFILNAQGIGQAQQLSTLIAAHRHVDLYVRVREDTHPFVPLQDSHFNLVELVMQNRAWAESVWTPMHTLDGQRAYWIAKGKINKLIDAKAVAGTYWITPNDFPRAVPEALLQD